MYQCRVINSSVIRENDEYLSTNLNLELSYDVVKLTRLVSSQASCFIMEYLSIDEPKWVLMNSLNMDLNLIIT